MSDNVIIKPIIMLYGEGNRYETPQRPDPIACKEAKLSSTWKKHWLKKKRPKKSAI